MCFCLVSGPSMDLSDGEDSPIYSPVSADVEPFSNDTDENYDYDDYDDVINYSQSPLMWAGPTDVMALSKKKKKKKFWIS